MKRATCGAGVFLVLALCAGEVCGSQTPQPRVRLQRDAAGTATASEGKALSPAERTTVLEKMTVTDSKIPTPPRPLQGYDGKTFSFTKGGPFREFSGKRYNVSIGLWRHEDVLPEISLAGSIHARFDLLRIQW